MLTDIRHHTPLKTTSELIRKSKSSCREGEGIDALRPSARAILKFNRIALSAHVPQPVCH